MRNAVPVVAAAVFAGPLLAKEEEDICERSARDLVAAMQRKYGGSWEFRLGDDFALIAKRSKPV